MSNFDARAHLTSLVGHRIYTVTGEWNDVLSVSGDEVMVRSARTKDSEGSPVPIAWLQEAADRLFEERYLSLRAADLNHRSAFMGAVLLTLEGVEGHTDPAHLTYEASDSAQLPFTNDELLMLLDCYLDRRAGRNRSFTGLSAALRGFHDNYAVDFRTPDGLRAAVRRFGYFEEPPTSTEYRPRYEPVWTAFADRPDELKALVESILAHPADATRVEEPEWQDGFIEGRVIFARHRRYERSEAARKKKAIAKSTACEVCGFSFAEVYGELGSDYIECHHVVPLHIAAQAGEVITNMDDLALVCANCHRMLHRGAPAPTLAELRSALRPGAS